MEMPPVCAPAHSHPVLSRVLARPQTEDKNLPRGAWHRPFACLSFKDETKSEIPP
jgi:hypothetical protein